MVMVIMWNLVGGEEAETTVDLKEGASADGRMVGEMVASTADAVFPAAIIAARPLVRAIFVRLIAAANTVTTTVRSGVTRPGAAAHLMRGSRIVTVETSGNRKDETPWYFSIARKRGICDRSACCLSGLEPRGRTQLHPGLRR